MKNKILIGLISLAIYGYGQTSEKKNNISIGGGTQYYNGDLGNSFFALKDEWYGVVGLNYSRYLNKSFDASFTTTTGDYGHCRDKEDPQFRSDGTEVLNMLSRLTTGIITLKYKFYNGYILKENAKISPFVYIGFGINNVTDFWWANKNRVNAGNYTSLNGGLGLRYNFCNKFNFTYNLGLGYFMTDKIDKRVEGINDMYLQNTFLIGMNF